jgi:hypothetical protein
MATMDKVITVIMEEEIVAAKEDKIFTHSIDDKRPFGAFCFLTLLTQSYFHIDNVVAIPGNKKD